MAASTVQIGYLCGGSEQEIANVTDECFTLSDLHCIAVRSQILGSIIHNVVVVVVALAFRLIRQ